MYKRQDGIPQDLKELYKTVYELSMKDIIDMSRHRGYFIDQSQSLNLFMENANYAKLTSMHFYAWKNGLKTGMYYLRTKAAVDAIKFTVEKAKKAEPQPQQQEVAAKAAETLQQAKTQLEPQAQTVQAPEVAKTQPVLFDNVSNTENTEELSPEELKAIIQQSKDAQGDDCLMCGS